MEEIYNLEQAVCVRSKGHLHCQARDAGPFADKGALPDGTLVLRDKAVCVLDKSGAVRCGPTERGYLDATEPLPNLKPVRGIEHALEIEITGEHGCARIEGGRVACWSLPGEDVAFIQGVEGAVKLTHACAVLGSGFVDCWGKYDHWGQAEVLTMDSSENTH